MWHAPSFWYKNTSWQAIVLVPLGWLYNTLSQARHRWARPWRAPVPVICVGNLTLGGTGKTPLVLFLAKMLQAQGHHPHIVSRGYGGNYGASCVRVDPAGHGSDMVGDEPLLLASVAPTWVCRDRRLGIKAAIAAGADCLILDDGFQNPTIHKDFSIVVVDGPVGFGNGQVFPAGPLRERLSQGMKRAHMICVIGKTRQCFPDSVPLLQGALVPEGPLPTIPVVAFAGIGRPGKFFDMLRDQGVFVAACRAFPDHHPYGPSDLSELKDLQRIHGATLVTTQKDFVRLDPDFAKTVEVVSVHLDIQNVAPLTQALEALFHVR